MLPLMTPVRVLLFMLLCASGGVATTLDWREPWRVPHDPAAARAHSDEYAWRLFAALNWPQGRGGDRGDRALLWERWVDSNDVYRDDGADPGPWRSGDANVVTAEQRFESLSSLGLANVRHIVAGRMVPREESLAGARRLVEIRMNRIAYDYIRSAGLYSLDGQMRRVAAGDPVRFPRGAIEVKANWRPIDPADAGRYYTARVRFADGSRQLLGLTALNVAAKELPTWFWASFEHADNPARPDADGWKLPSQDAYACRGRAPDCNESPRLPGVGRGVWQFYRLRGTMTGYLDAAGGPRRLGNSELEAGFQESSSCMTCHARAALAVVAGVPARLPVFRESAGDDARQRRGYVGMPERAWFGGDGVGARREPAYLPLDFVWSLAQAKARGNGPLDTTGDLQ